MVYTTFPITPNSFFYKQTSFDQLLNDFTNCQSKKPCRYCIWLSLDHLMRYFHYQQNVIYSKNTYRCASEYIVFLLSVFETIDVQIEPKNGIDNKNCTIDSTVGYSTKFR